MMTSLHWFRRDLRLSDHPALAAAVSGADAVLPVFVLSTWKGTHRWTGPNRQAFLCGCLASLDANLRAIGGRLIVRAGDPVGEILALARAHGVRRLTYVRDPDPFGRRTEERMEREARSMGLEVLAFDDVCLHAPSEIRTGNGEPYRVFTPFLRTWTKLRKPGIVARPRNVTVPDKVESLPLPSLAHWGLEPAAPGIVEAGEKAAHARLGRFVRDGLARYGAVRDIPSIASTSRLSQDLRFGVLSPRQIYGACSEALRNAPHAERMNGEKFLAEIAWREFYIHILHHFPGVLDGPFNPKFHKLEWPGTDEDFERWCAGRTGFPIVDAAMRELLHTGFMHNRARMITAMFLTKDLHVHWQRGEEWFLRQLVDGEIASNNGGWQWSAGTGADAAPYFRIQNPWSQTKRFDPDGTYIRQWVPEIAHLPAARFMEPPAPGLSLAKDYPAPMVEHSAERERTLELFAAAGKD